MRTDSIWPRRMPFSDRPGMKLSCRQPTISPPSSTTASSWLGSASIAAKASA